MRQSPKRKSQRERVLEALVNARGGWVTALELANVGGLQWQTRIWELRHNLQFKIENREERRDGICFSEYRLVPNAPTTLFDMLPPDRTYQE